MCRTESLVYQAVVGKGDPEIEESYVGITGGEFKVRYTQHKNSFKYRSKRNSTALSKYIWELYDKGIEPTITWYILGQAPVYNPAMGRCMLCLNEKYIILYMKELASLNSRSEISNTCRHRRKFILSND